jgi:hypothetical protein
MCSSMMTAPSSVARFIPASAWMVVMSLAPVEWISCESLARSEICRASRSLLVMMRYVASCRVRSSLSICRRMGRVSMLPVPPCSTLLPDDASVELVGCLFTCSTLPRDHVLFSFVIGAVWPWGVGTQKNNCRWLGSVIVQIFTFLLRLRPHLGGLPIRWVLSGGGW